MQYAKKGPQRQWDKNSHGRHHDVCCMRQLHLRAVFDHFSARGPNLGASSCGTSLKVLASRSIYSCFSSESLWLITSAPPANNDYAEAVLQT